MNLDKNTFYFFFFTPKSFRLCEIKPPISLRPVLLLNTFSNRVHGQSNVLLKPKCIIQMDIGNATYHGSNIHTKKNDVPVNIKTVQCIH